MNGTGTFAHRANFYRARLVHTNLKAADLSDADLSCANLTSANLTNATLDGVRWSDTTCPDGTVTAHAGGTCAGHLSAR
jgi:uncharacterized protein YjbI with pentapeptide repeats